jgi:hypothetical protein
MSCTLLAPFAACRFLGGVSDLADERAQSLRNCLVTVTRGVLVDHRCTDTGVPEPSHQLFERGARRGRERATRMPQVMKMKFRHADRGARFDPDRLVEVRAAQLAALRPDKTKPRSPGSANRSRCQLTSGTISSGNATVRLPARDFGVPGRRPPLSRRRAARAAGRRQRSASALAGPAERAPTRYRSSLLD